MGFVNRYIRLLRECERDARVYFRYSTTNGYTPGHVATQHESEIMRLSHSIEKSLCMPGFKPRSAQSSVLTLISLLAIPDIRKLIRRDVAATADAVLYAYRAKNKLHDSDVNDLFVGWCQNDIDETRGGIMPWSPADPSDSEAYRRFFLSRHSLRSFDTKRIPDPSALRCAIELACHAPSVCNRQTWRVHTFTGSIIKEILSLQNGNRGFGHTIPAVLIVTSDMRYFTGIEERYQPWIECGIYTMALLLALHSEGFGAVPLNWSVDSKNDTTLHSITKIPAYERVSVIVGVGMPDTPSTVPISSTHILNHSIVH